MLPTLPSPKLEAWRFTPLARLLPTTQTTSETISETNLTALLATLLKNLATTTQPRLVLVDGTPHAALSQLPPTTATLTSTTQPTALLQLDVLDTTPFTTHHTLTLAPGAHLQLVHVHTQPQARHALTISLPSGTAEPCTLTEYHLAPPATHGWAHQHMHLSVPAHTMLHHGVVQQLPPGWALTRRSHWQLAEHAHAHHHALQVGAGFARLENHVTTAAHSHHQQTTLHLGRAQQQHDAVFTATLTAPSAHLHIRQRNLLEDAAHSVFQGKFLVQQAAQKTDAYMHCHSLLLSPTAKVSLKPELEIYADDVKCSHGAAVGTLDAAQLFYLQARGLSPTAARALLLQAQVDDLLADFPPTLQPHATQLAHQWLGLNPAEAPLP
jgi:Fe-S cluster assembly protein SufD